MDQTPLFIQYRDSSGIVNHLIIEDFDHENNILINAIYDLMDAGQSFYQSCLTVFDRMTSQYEMYSGLGRRAYVKSIFADSPSTFDIDSRAKKLISYRDFNNTCITIYADEVVVEGEGTLVERKINNMFPESKYGSYSFDFNSSSERICAEIATGVGESRRRFPLFSITESNIHCYL